MHDCTAGQARVRTRTYERRSSYQAAGRPRYDHPVLLDLRDALADDDVVTCDAVTAAPLTDPTLAKTYIRLLKGRCPANVVSRNFPHVRLDRFLYDRPDGQPDAVRYTGGVKWASTMSCLFGLAEHAVLEPIDCNAAYFMTSGILTIDLGGNHRLLAHVLWGNPHIAPYDLIVYDDEHHRDESLNTVLLEIEAMYPKRFPFRVRDAKDDAEIEALYAFVAETTAQDRAVISDFITWVVARGNGWIQNHYHLNAVDGLCQCLYELRIIQARPWWWPLQRRLSQLFGNEQPLQSFTLWHTGMIR